MFTSLLYLHQWCKGVKGSCKSLGQAIPKQYRLDSENSLKTPGKVLNLLVLSKEFCPKYSDSLRRPPILGPWGASQVREEADPGCSDTRTFYLSLPFFQTQTPIFRNAGQWWILQRQLLEYTFKACSWGSNFISMEGFLAQSRSAHQSATPARTTAFPVSFVRQFIG